MLISRADLRPGQVSLQFCPRALAARLALETDQVSAAFLSTCAPFTQRRRGVELKLYLGAAPPEIDRTLVQNIMTARRWLERILDGDNSREMAVEEGTSKRRVQDLVDLALLALDLTEAVVEGTQPGNLTTDRLIKTGLPAAWSAQRAKFAAP